MSDDYGETWPPLIAQHAEIGTASGPTPDGVVTMLALAFEGFTLVGADNKPEPRAVTVYMPTANLGGWLGTIAEVVAGIEPDAVQVVVRFDDESEVDGDGGR